ncbi:MAG: hypothetical protein K5870_06605 [Lachnospiraceae bacterium]|nr:hypothetical protein [Lachnospiraceae bacterium]
MTRCPSCKITLYHNEEVCPLCSCVTEEINSDEESHIRARFGDASYYPNVQKRQKILRFILKLVLFIFVVAEAIMVSINYMTHVSYPWSLITGVSLIYIYLFLVYWVTYDSGFAAKVGLQLMITMIFLLIIDYTNGMHGWSLQWAIPGIILLGDGLVFFLMILNKSRWQSYLLLLLLMAICSIAILTLYFAGKIHIFLMPLICSGVSCLSAFGAILFGGKSAQHELKRRIHI